ncbi:MAG: helix-turn-helix domain-containing protein [Firmicutes bacterium]|nr:helix-turn-helix domain-containing protein [Bacillota bacterium]
MNNKAIKSMMNPVRLKIIREMTQKKEVTTKEIQEICGDIPQATLYRHLIDLRKNGMIEVVSENQVRGTVERVYALKNDPLRELKETVRKMTKDGLSELFSQFIISILSDVDAYFKQLNDLKNLDKEFALRYTSLFLSDEEFIDVKNEINELLEKRSSNEASPVRKLRKISTIATTSSDTLKKE